MNSCMHCNQQHELRNLFETGSGLYCCEGCVDQYCYSCLEETPSIETNDGEYICVDCYSGMCSNAYDYVKGD